MLPLQRKSKPVPTKNKSFVVLNGIPTRTAKTFMESLSRSIRRSTAYMSAGLAAHPVGSHPTKSRETAVSPRIFCIEIWRSVHSNLQRQRNLACAQLRIVCMLMVNEQRLIRLYPITSQEQLATPANSFGQIVSAQRPLVHSNNLLIARPRF